jgi:hypothetical protein
LFYINKKDKDETGLLTRNTEDLTIEIASPKEIKDIIYIATRLESKEPSQACNYDSREDIPRGPAESSPSGRPLGVRTLESIGGLGGYVRIEGMIM